MKTMPLIQAAAVFVWSVAALAEPNSQNQTPAATAASGSVPGALRESDRTWKSSDGKIQLLSKLPEQVREGEALPLDITLINGEADALRFINDVDGWPRQNCKVTVTNEKREECVPTEKGMMKFGGHDLRYAQFSGGIIDIDPEKSKTWSADLQPLFSLKPGKYFITLEFRVSSFTQQVGQKPIPKKSYLLKISEMPFTIAEAPAK